MTVYSLVYLSMDRDELMEALRTAVDLEQKMYDLYKRIAEEAMDEDLSEFFGFMAHEEFSHLSTITDKYEKLVNAS